MMSDSTGEGVSLADAHLRRCSIGLGIRLTVQSGGVTPLYTVTESAATCQLRSTETDFL